MTKPAHTLCVCGILRAILCPLRACRPAWAQAENRGLGIQETRRSKTRSIVARKATMIEEIEEPKKLGLAAAVARGIAWCAHLDTRLAEFEDKLRDPQSFSPLPRVTAQSPWRGTGESAENPSAFSRFFPAGRSGRGAGQSHGASAIMATDPRALAAAGRFFGGRNGKKEKAKGKSKKAKVLRRRRVRSGEQVIIVAGVVAAVFELPASCRHFGNVGRAGWEPFGWASLAREAGVGERGMACGKHFLKRAAFQRGKPLENKLKNGDLREGTARKKTLKTSHIFPLYPRPQRGQPQASPASERPATSGRQSPDWSARDLRGGGQALVFPGRCPGLIYGGPCGAKSNTPN